MQPMAQQPLQMQQQPMQMMYDSPIPGNAPPTIVIDTSPQAMQQSGYEGNGQMQMQMQRRNVTPRARANSPRGSGNSRGPISIPGFNPATSRVTVQKLG